VAHALLFRASPLAFSMVRPIARCPPAPWAKVHRVRADAAQERDALATRRKTHTRINRNSDSVRWHSCGTLPAAKSHQLLQGDPSKSLSLRVSTGVSLWRLWTFNPPVDGSIPSRPTLKFLKIKAMRDFYRIPSLSFCKFCAVTYSEPLGHPRRCTHASLGDQVRTGCASRSAAVYARVR